MSTASALVHRENSSWILQLQGSWTRDTLPDLVIPDDWIPSEAVDQVVIDGQDLQKLDTIGALRLHSLCARLEKEGHTPKIEKLSPAFQTLLEATPSDALSFAEAAKGPKDPLGWIVDLGKLAEDHYKEAKNLVAFLGLIMETYGRLFLKPQRFRLTSFIFHIQKTGLDALPILGLLSLLIGVVLAYQGADQLRAFGADRYVVNLLGISILREIGVLLTAIIVAGRSGSAFTAQIGTMKVNQEIDAMQTFNLNAVEFLVVPRILALIVALPLLVLYSDIMGLLGGAVMTYATLSISPEAFMSQLETAVTTTTLWVGLIKAPVFAFAIGMVGCYQGLRVGGSAESVGTRTTKSVVQAIFLVIILDALFSIVFSIMKI